MKRLWCAAAFASLSLLLGCAQSAAPAPEIVFTDVVQQTQQFIDYESSIQLSVAQLKLRDEALSALPAPCCSDNSAATCCCPCNLARSVWGLSNYLITRHDAGVPEIRAKVSEWVEFINPDGFSGEVCYTGGCVNAFADGGCGGMSPAQLVF